ncbi:MAG: metallophosphoesterase [Bacteroidota bacterium]
MLLSWMIWIAIVAFVMGGGFAYVGWRLITPMALPGGWKAAAWTLVGALFFLPVFSMFFLRFAEGVGSWWSWFVYSSLGFLSFVFTLLVFRDLLLVGGNGIGWLLALFQPRGGGATDPARRLFLVQVSNLAVIGAAGALTAYGVYQARRKPGIVDLKIPIANLPGSFEGFRIVQITDIHAGLTVKRDWIETIAGQVEELRPDLIAFTGDLVDGSVSHLREDVAPLAQLQAPHGKFFVTGNHEYYSGAEPWVEEIDRMGYKVLMNEHQVISSNGASMVLAGVTDYSGGTFLPHHQSDPAKAMEGAPADMVKILMAHQPRSLYAAEPLGFDLILTGHTHGGQFFPWNLLATIGQPYIKGLHKRNGGWVYVSKGTGYWGPPVRLGARSEITVFTLTRGAALS